MCQDHRGMASTASTRPASEDRKIPRALPTLTIQPARMTARWRSPRFQWPGQILSPCPQHKPCPATVNRRRVTSDMREVEWDDDAAAIAIGRCGIVAPGLPDGEQSRERCVARGAARRWTVADLTVWDGNCCSPAASIGGPFEHRTRFRSMDARPVAPQRR